MGGRRPPKYIRSDDQSATQIVVAGPNGAAKDCRTQNSAAVDGIYI